MDDPELRKIVRNNLANFYNRRLKKLSELRLKDVLRKKNPYLFRAIGIEKGWEVVERPLQAFMSSSEEGIFGGAFFEPVAKEVARHYAARNPDVHITDSEASGVDIIWESKSEHRAISIKSGPNWGNSSQMAKLEQDFQRARRVFDDKRTGRAFKALLGHCYGRKLSSPGEKRNYHVRSGQAFWEELTGDTDFYLRLTRLMEDYPVKHRIAYKKEWNKVVNRFTKELLLDFCNDEGQILWDKLVEFNSGKNK